MTDEIRDRLIRGAALLGKLARKKEVCSSGWAPTCPCAEPKDFCRAKALWVTLAAEDGRETPGTPTGIVDAMTFVELEASGLTVTYDVPEAGPVAVGPKGVIPFGALAKLAGGGLRTVLPVLAKFPGSKVVSEEARR